MSPRRLVSRHHDRDLRWLADARLSVRAYELRPSSRDSTFCVSTRSSELTFVLAGEMEVRLGGSTRVVSAGAGEGLVVLRGTPHLARAKVGPRIVIVDVPFVPTDALGVVPLAAGEIPLAFERIVPPLWEQRASIGETALHAAMCAWSTPQAFRRVLRLDEGHATARLLRVKRSLEDRYRDPISIEDVAARFGMDRYYLARNYHRAFGVAPLGYVQALRLEHFAWSLLDASAPDSLLTLANRAGFGDYATFCRRVRKRLGRAPSELLSPPS